VFFVATIDPYTAPKLRFVGKAPSRTLTRGWFQGEIAQSALIPGRAKEVDPCSWNPAKYLKKNSQLSESAGLPAHPCTTANQRRLVITDAPADAH